MRFVLLLAVLSLLEVSCTRTPKTFGELYEKDASSAFLAGFEHSQKISGKDSTDVQKFGFENQTVFVQKRELHPAAALRYIQDRKTEILGIFTPDKKCQGDFLPKIFDLKNGAVIELYANSQFTFSGCEKPTDTVYKTLYLMVYCESRTTFYDIKLFSADPAKVPPAEQFFNDFRCK